MSARSVVVRLQADVADFRRNFRAAGADATSAMTDVGLAASAAGAAALAGVAVSINAWAKFDAAMSGVQASTHGSEQAMSRLADAALEAGATTVFSATEAAGAIDELAKAGVSTGDILGGGLDGALSLAAAGSLEVGKAAEIAATALTQFQLAGADIPHVADLLAAAAGKAQGSVEDMGMALKQGGLVASQTGLTIEETTGGLAAFAAAGLTGSDAGTSFKTMLQALTPSSKEAEAKMRELGISAYDSQGEFIGLAQFAGNLQDSLAGLSTEQQNAALKTIFGSDAVRAASVLYQEGEAGVREWTAAVNDQGYAAETAAIKLDNLKGDTEALGGALETAFIGAGSAGDDFARGTVQAVTKVVDLFNGLSSSGQGVALGVVAVTGAITLVGGAALVTIPKIIALRTAMSTLTGTSARAAGALKTLAIAGGVAIGVTALAVGAAALANALNDAGEAPGTNALINSLDALANGGEESIGRLDRAFSNFAETGFGGESLAEVNDLGSAIDRAFSKTKSQQVEDFFGSIGGFFGATTEMDLLAERFTGVDTALSQMVESGHADQAKEAFAQIVAQFEAAGLTAEDAAAAFPAYTDALDGVAATSTETARSQEAIAAAAAEVEQNAVGAEDALSALKDTLDALNGAQLDANEATRAYEGALDDAEKKLKDNGATLDVTTEKGRENAEALDKIAESAAASAKALIDNGGDQAQFRASLDASRAQLFTTAKQFGMTDEAAQAYVDSVLAIPSQATTNAVFAAQAATAALNGYAAKVKEIAVQRVQTSVFVDIIARGGNTGGGLADGGVVDYFADGGMNGPFASRPGAEQHIAQIVPAGSWRVFGEPETGGEAYIPLAPSKRARSRNIAEETIERLGGAVRWFADGGIDAGQTVTAAWLASAQAAAGKISPVSGDRFMRASADDAAGARALAAAERTVLDVRAANVVALKALRDANEEAEDAAAARLEAEDDAADRRLEQIKAEVKAEEQAFKDRQDQEKYEFDQRAERSAEGAKRASDDALKALKAKNKDGALDKAIADLERRQKDGAQSDEVRAEDAKRAFKLAQEAAARDLEARQNAYLTSVEDELTAAKKRRKDAVDDLKDSNDDLVESEQARADAALTEEEDRLTAAKEAAAKATDELRAAEEELSAAREKALALAEQVAGAITKAFDLDALVGNGGSFEQVIARATKEVARAKELSDSIVALTDAGLDASLIDQLTAGGTAGLDTVRKLISGGTEGVAALNEQLRALTSVGAGLGTYVADTRYAPGGAAAAPGYGTVTLDKASVVAVAEAITARPVTLVASGTQIATVVTAAQDRVSYLTQGARR